jgi:hypothetical protein
MVLSAFTDFARHGQSYTVKRRALFISGTLCHARRHGPILPYIDNFGRHCGRTDLVLVFSKKIQMNTNNIFLKPDEGKFIALACIRMLEDLKNTANNPKINWLPEVRKTLKEMTEAGERLKIKLTKLGFDMSELPELFPGEENDYLTKEG